MLHVHHFCLAPMEVKGYKGYLLVELAKGIARYPPRPNACVPNLLLHEGHTACDAVSSRLFTLL